MRTKWGTWAAVAALAAAAGPAGGCASRDATAESKPAAVDPAVELYRIQAVQFIREKERELQQARSKSGDAPHRAINTEVEHVSAVLESLNASHPSLIGKQHVVEILQGSAASTP